MPPDRVILFIIGTVVILFGAYYVTYYIGMKASGQTRAGLRNRNIVVLDRYSIARDKCFCVVEIAGKVYVVGVTNNSMTLLDSIDSETFAELTSITDEKPQMPWGNTPVGQYGNKLTKKVVAFVAAKTGKSAGASESAAAASATPAASESGSTPAKETFQNTMKKATQDVSEDD